MDLPLGCPGASRGCLGTFPQGPGASWEVPIQAVPGRSWGRPGRFPEGPRTAWQWSPYRGLSREVLGMSDEEVTEAIIGGALG